MTSSAEALWNALPKEVAASVILAIATVVTGAMGAAAVFWQIARQARNAISQNRDNEKLKLKLKIYEEIVGICLKASDVEVDLSMYIRLFHDNLLTYQNIAAQLLQPVIPHARVPQLIEKKTAVDLAVVDS